MNTALPRLLIIAGSDSSGGAGLQADIRTATAFGVCAMTAVTAVTAQDTAGVHAIHLVPAALVRDQIASCLADTGCDAIKIGMLGSAEIVTTVANILGERARGIPVVLDPVLASTSGTSLLDDDGRVVMRERLFPITTLLTPNFPEAERLTGTKIRNIDDIRRAGESLRSLGCQAVLIKGGHAQGEAVEDVLVYAGGAQTFASSRIPGAGVRGTGCMLATAIACGLAQQIPLTQSIAHAREFVRDAIHSVLTVGPHP